MADERRPQIIVPPATDEEAEPSAPQTVAHPSKLLRIASMIRELVEEVRQTSIDEAGRERLRQIYGRSVGELKEGLSEDLQRELDSLAVPLEQGASEGEIRVAQAQLLGWLEGLFHGIQAALWAQHMQAQATLQEMRRRGLPSGVTPGQRETPEPPGGPGQYL